MNPVLLNDVMTVDLAVEMQQTSSLLGSHTDPEGSNGVRFHLHSSISMIRYGPMIASLFSPHGPARWCDGEPLT